MHTYSVMGAKMMNVVTCSEKNCSNGLKQHKKNHPNPTST